MGPDVPCGVVGISGYFSLRLHDNDDVSVLEKNMIIIILPSQGAYVITTMLSFPFLCFYPQVHIPNYNTMYFVIYPTAHQNQHR